MVAFKDSKGLWEKEETLKSTKTSYCSCKGILVASIAVFLVPSCGEEALVKNRQWSLGRIRVPLSGVRVWFAEEGRKTGLELGVLQVLSIREPSSGSL